jgi:hypothetical protein
LIYSLNNCLCVCCWRPHCPPTNCRRFGEFEKFIYDFLVGTAGSSSGSMRSGGEGLRLKLQTPLFVADALMEAARVRVQGEIAAAQGELAALEAVKRQLAKFQVGGGW